MTNDQLHKDAVKLLIDRKSATLKSKDYNQRRRQATADLQPILKQIWACLKRGESVGGHTTIGDWAASQSITTRQCNRIIEGYKPQKRHDVCLKVGMTVTVDGAKVVLTQALIDFLSGTSSQLPTPKKVAKKLKTVACDLCGYKKCQCAEIQRGLKSTAILHAMKTGWGADATLCNTPITYHDGISGPSMDPSNVGKGKSVNCPKCLEKRTAQTKKAAETRAVNKSLQTPEAQTGIDEAIRQLRGEEAKAATV